MLYHFDPNSHYIYRTSYKYICLKVIPRKNQLITQHNMFYCGDKYIYSGLLIKHYVGTITVHVFLCKKKK